MFVEFQESASEKKSFGHSVPYSLRMCNKPVILTQVIVFFVPLKFTF